MDAILAYFYSLATYSCFQFFDMYSTKLALSKLQIEKHEINPLLVFLNKRIGINASFLLMWFVIANSVAAFDALYIQNIFGLTLACFFFGMFHVFAVFNNLQIHFETQFVGADNFERNTEFLIRELRNRSSFGKVALLLRLNLFSVFLSLFGIATLFLSIQLLNFLQFRLVEPINAFLLYFPPMMILALILFFPVKVFGMFVICRRRLQLSKSPDNSPQNDHAPLVSLSVDVLETALKDARVNNAKYVQFSLTRKEDQETECNSQ